MCELFAMSSLIPTNVSFSMSAFSQHSSATAGHRDGWGVVFFEDNDARIIKETEAADRSACLEFVKHHDFESHVVISHIRNRTQGEISYRNTQPFARELGGRMHAFVHNGDLDMDQLLLLQQHISCSNFLPLGNTDSEHAFCALMNMLAHIWQAELLPSLRTRYEVISAFAMEISDFGPANFIYSDGEYLFIYSHKRKQKGRDGYHPPGLHILNRICRPEYRMVQVPGVNTTVTDKTQQIVLVATVPLTDEAWIPLDQGELRVARRGVLVQP